MTTVIQLGENMIRLKGTLLAAFILAFLSAMPGQAEIGGVDEEMIESFRNSCILDGHNRSMYNALTNDDITDIALNREIVQQHNVIFSNKLKVSGITNQKSSGRCWLFSSLNMLRPAVMEKYKLNKFEFSQNFLAFWDKLEKANTFLEYVIAFRDRDPLDRELTLILERPISDGGYWHYTKALIEKYGLVPSEAMAESNSSGKTKDMNRVIGTKLRSDAAKLRRMNAEGKSLDELRSAKVRMLGEVYKMLVFNLGSPPDSFVYHFENRDSVVSEAKSFTPISFYKDFVDLDLDEYVDIYNDPSRDYGKHYSIALTRNMYDSDDIKYANAPIEVLKEIALKALLADEPVLFGCDVGKDQSRDLGIMAVGLYDYGSIYDVDFSMTKAERSLYRESTVNHAMVFVGIDIKDGKPVKWRVENSWGDNSGGGGYWTMYDDWFDEHVYDVIVKKKYVPKEILEIYEQEPIVLPVWDPMWGFLR